MPQGGSASPLLANIYLHDVIVLGFQVKADAELFWAELAEPVRQFRLELHPEKTRFSASRISAGRRGAMDDSRCCGRRFENGCRRS